MQILGPYNKTCGTEVTDKSSCYQHAVYEIFSRETIDAAIVETILEKQCKLT